MKTYSIEPRDTDSKKLFFAVVCDDGITKETIFTSESYSDCNLKIIELELPGIIERKFASLNSVKIDKELLQVSTHCLNGLLYSVGHESMSDEMINQYTTEAMKLAKTLIKKVQDAS